MSKQPINIKVTNAEAAKIAERTQDAYSFDRYAFGAWTMTAKRLAQRGYDAQQIEAVLRSKIMRWAGDAVPAGRTQPTSADVLRYLDEGQNGTPAYIEQLTREAFGENRLHPHARGLRPSDTQPRMDARYTVTGAHRTPSNPEGTFLMVASLAVIGRVFGLHERAITRIESEASPSKPCRIQLRTAFGEETAIDLVPGVRLV